MRTHTFIAVGLSGALGGFWVNACSVDTNGAAPEPNDGSVADGTPDVTTPPADVVEPKEAAVDARMTTDTGVADGGDAAVCNATNCGGACCGNQCVPRTCAGCANGSTFCPFSAGQLGLGGSCVSDCSACDVGDAGPAIACFACGAGTRVTSCAPNPSGCPSTLLMGACSCNSADAGQCPGPDQACVVAHQQTGEAEAGDQDAGEPAASQDAGNLSGGNQGASGICLTCGQTGTDGQPCPNGKTCVEATGTCTP